MVSKRVHVNHPEGLHMRPAGEFVKLVTPYLCEIKIEQEEKRINGKSILSLMTACITYGTQITIICDGPQEVQCLQAAAAFVEKGAT